ncbi:TolC family protein [Massilia timonae]|uniref:Cobalt-zinc-cadmium resistance protein CzcC n=1 Tax=Massilia timonae TaxID=47229 RepID=A0A1S2NC65_9BURK|nr:TolC family protein [Massilia timonae]OIJ42443.1 cobalt-zinc-cadmium resistance protein CzcC [Massilia timonae]
MKHRLTPLLAALALACGFASASAAAWSAPLTLEAAIDLALRANPTLRAAGSEVAAQEGALAQAGALPNPELELLREGEGSSSRTTTATLNIAIELGGKRAARVEAARQEGALAAIALEAERDKVRADAAAAFHDVVAAQERERMARELVALAGRALAAAGKRVEAGTLSPVEETRARVAQGSARIEALQAGRDLEGARIRLAALWGGDARQLSIHAPQAAALPPAAPLDQLLAQLDRSPAMRHARAQVGQREALARLERARRTPDVNVIVGAQREGPDTRNRAVLGLSVPLPLFNRNDGAVLDALRRVDKARDQQDAEGVRLRAELAQAHARLTAALAECALISTEILPGAEDAERSANRGFELGKFGLIDVLDAQRVLAQSKNQYLNAVAESHRAAADIARLLGHAAVQENP